MYQGGTGGSGSCMSDDLNTLERVLEENANKADLIVFPECFLGGYTSAPHRESADEYLEEERLRDIVKKHHVAVCVGVAVRNTGTTKLSNQSWLLGNAVPWDMCVFE